MNTSSSMSNSGASLQGSQIIRLNYPRPLIDRKPDDDPSVHSAPRIVISAGPPSSTSATVPQIVSILNTSTNAAAISNAKKCTFHRQCLHIQSPQSQQAGQHQSPQAPPQLIQHHQIQLPLQTPPQLLQHPQILQQQQIRISNPQIPTSNSSTSAVIASAAAAAVNRASTQANRDAISTNISPPPMNAALLQDRYLLLDLVDGSSFYKCIDIQTQKMLVCKVSLLLCLFASEMLCASASGWGLIARTLKSERHPGECLRIVTFRGLVLSRWILVGTRQKRARPQSERTSRLGHQNVCSRASWMNRQHGMRYCFSINLVQSCTFWISLISDVLWKFFVQHCAWKKCCWLL